MGNKLYSLRCSERREIVLPARCRSKSGFLDRVVITDISREGCRIESRALTLHTGDRVVVRPDVLEGLCGEVRWVNGHSAGIRFAEPLYGPVVDHLHRNFASFLGAMQPEPVRALRRVA